MTTLAERLAPRLYGPLIHPGDADTPPFPMVSPLAGLQTATMPPGMAEDIAEQAGLPHTNFARIWLEAVLHLVSEEGYEILEKDAVADLRAAAEVREHKRNQMIEFVTPCGAHLRAMARGFDTEHPSVPCEMVRHECGVR